MGIKKMKILVYGMQSSGASFFTYFLAQKPNTFAIVDLGSWATMPRIQKSKFHNAVIKCVINKKIPYLSYVRNYGPDKTILFVRNPFDNYLSLKKKKYADNEGSIDVKFKLLEKIFLNHDKFDLTVFYEEFIFTPFKVLRKLNKLGLGLKKEFFNFQRSPNDIYQFNSKKRKEFSMFKYKFCFGRIHFNFSNQTTHLQKNRVYKIINQKEREKIRQLCPTLCKFYEKNFPKYIMVGYSSRIKSIFSVKLLDFILKINKNIFVLYLRVDRFIGLIGIFLKNHFPKLYIELKKLKK